VDRPALPPSSHTAAFITPPTTPPAPNTGLYMFYTNSQRSNKRWFFVINFNIMGFADRMIHHAGKKSDKRCECGQR
jgi:hypothetical protein